MTKKGVYISSELGPNGQNLLFSLSTALSNGNKVIFPIPFQTTESIPYIIALLKKEKFKPLIDRKYSIDSLSDAYTYALSGEKKGNLIVEFP